MEKSDADVHRGWVGSLGLYRMRVENDGRHPTHEGAEGNAGTYTMVGVLDGHMVTWLHQDCCATVRVAPMHLDVLWGVVVVVTTGVEKGGRRDRKIVVHASKMNSYGF